MMEILTTDSQEIAFLHRELLEEGEHGCKKSKELLLPLKQALIGEITAAQGNRGASRGLGSGVSVSPGRFCDPLSHDRGSHSRHPLGRGDPQDRLAFPIKARVPRVCCLFVASPSR